MDEDTFIRLFKRGFEEVVLPVLDRLEKRIDKLEYRLGDIETRLEQLGSKVGWITDKVIQIEFTVKDYGKCLDNIDIFHSNATLPYSSH